MVEAPLRSRSGPRSVSVRAITDRLGVLFDPHFWFRQGHVSHAYDRALCGALDEYGVRLHPYLKYTIYVGEAAIWSGNYPYAFAHPAREVFGPHTLPRRATAKRIRRMMDEALWPDRSETASHPNSTDEGAET